MLPTLTDLSTCPIPQPESATTEVDDLALIASRDWFTDDGSPAVLADTLDDSRYSLSSLRGVPDVVDDFGATPFVSIDLMPCALAANKTPLRTSYKWTFQNQVSNVRPESAPIFAAAVTGTVEAYNRAAPLLVEEWGVGVRPKLLALSNLGLRVLKYSSFRKVELEKLFSRPRRLCRTHASGDH